MSQKEIDSLVARYEADPGIAYELDHDQLQILLGAVGEMDPIIDAIGELNGDSYEQRAEAIGVHVSDYDYALHMALVKL